MLDMKKECKAIVDNGLLDDMLFYMDCYPEQREEFCIELIKAVTQTVYQVKEEIEDYEDECC